MVPGLTGTNGPSVGPKVEPLSPKGTDATSSLWKCCNRRTKLCNEFDAMSQAMEVITDAPSSREMEHRLNTLQTSLSVVERSITKFENLIEDCRMLEEEVRRIEEDEAHLEEEICQEQEEEIANVEMAEEEKHGDPESPSPCREADTEGPPLLASAEDAVSPEEDALLMQPALQPRDPAAGSHSPRSETGTVSGEMAKLYLTSQANLGTRRMRPNCRSLPSSITV